MGIQRVLGDAAKGLGLVVRVSVDGMEVAKVNEDLVQSIAEAAEIMIRKNTERGDCWRATGMLGGFIELHSCYNRLRELIWERRPQMDDESWRHDIKDCCQDLRNFSILIELALSANVYAGDDREKWLACPNCGHKTAGV